MLMQASDTESLPANRNWGKGTNTRCGVGSKSGL